MSQISVCSATEISRVDQDMEAEMSPQHHDLDHAYSAPQQVVEVTDVPGVVAQGNITQPGAQSPENPAPIPTATRDSVAPQYPVTEIKPDYDELRPVKLEAGGVNLSPGSYHPDHRHIGPGQLLIDQPQTMAIDNSLILGLILDIPVKDVPYSVTHDDLFKALSVTDDKIAVRTMRKVIPCLRITTYIQQADYTGKKKIKGLWAKKPTDWPPNTPYKDPNNGEKVDGTMVPKANSEELKSMFNFLKKKFMHNIQEKLNQLSADDVERIKSAAAQQTQQYDFNQQPATPKSSSPNYSHISRGGQQYQEPVLVKQELGRFCSQIPTEGNQIPTFVNEFCNSSPENEPEQPQEQTQSLYCVASDGTSLDQLPPGQYVEYTDEQGNRMLVQCNGSPVSSEQEASPSPEVPETVIETAPQDIRAAKRSAPVEAEGEGMSPVVVSGKRVCEVVDTTESRGPIQQVSSPTTEVIQDQPQGFSHVPPKATIEVAPQLRSDTPASKLVPPTSQSRSTLPMTPFSAGGSMVPPVYSPVSPMPMTSHLGQFRTDIRGTLIHDLHGRIREKINYLQNMTLGDVELSIKLNTMYQSVLWNHYERAQKNEPNNFINAVHACEALVERALCDGNNFSRNTFKDDCDTIIAKYSGDADMTQKLVLHVSEPEHPPVQREILAKLQSGEKTGEPSPNYPKSPGTFLSRQMDELAIDQSPTSSNKMDVNQLGIRTKVQPEEMMQHLQNLVYPRSQPTSPEENENQLPLPEKLAVLGQEVSPDKTSDDVLKLFITQLDELKKISGGLSESEEKKDQLMDNSAVITVDDSHEVITIEDDSDIEDGEMVNLQHGSLVHGMIPGSLNKPVQIQQQVTGTDFNNPAPAPASWHRAEQQMKQAIGASQPSDVITDTNMTSNNEGLMDTDELLDTVIGLENTYDHFEIMWKDRTSSDVPSVQPTQTVQQPTTADRGHLYLASQNSVNPLPPPYPGLNSSNRNAENGDNPYDLLQIFQSVFESSLTVPATAQPVYEDRPAPELCIPEVVENYHDDMDYTETEPKPGTRGRKRGCKGKAKK